MAEAEKLTAETLEALVGGPFMDLFRNQLLICAVNRAGGSIVLPVAEVDGTGAYLLEVTVDGDAKTFTLTTSKKH